MPDNKQDNKSDKNQPLRILHVAFTIHDKSLQKWLFHILKATKHNDVVIDLMTTADEAPIFQPVIEQIGGKILVCPHPKNKGAFLRYVRECLSGEGGRSYDLVHTHPFIMGGEIMVQAFRANIPVRLMHAHLDRRKTRRNKSLFSRLKHKISTLLIKRLSTHGLAVNSATAEDIYGKDWHKDGRWQLMPYGINLSQDSPLSADKNIKAKMGIPSGAKVITQVDDFYFEKNHDLTLELFAHEARTNLSLVLVLVGSGSLKQKIQNKIIALGIDERVVFIGRDSDLNDILSITDLMIVPAIYEFDLVPMLQAQSMGIPVLASDHIPHDVAMHDDLMSFISLDHEMDVWSRAFKSMLSRGKMDSDKAKELVTNSQYNIERNVSVLNGLYQEVREK